MADIKISSKDLNDPAIDEIIQLQKSLQRTAGEFIEDVKTPIYLNPVFYYGLASAISAVLVWILFEPYYNDGEESIPFFSDYLLFGPVAGMIGLGIGFSYGLSNRNLRQGAYCCVVGIGVGLVATMLTTFIADILFGISSAIAASLGDGKEPKEGEFPLHGAAFFLFMCGRGLAWAVVSMGAGIALGVAQRSKKLLLNGLAGGLTGGLLGGLLFDPISRFITHDAEDASLSRGIGILVVGLLVGLFIGLFENISKDAWLLMLKGPLTGKQFNIFKSPLVIGSAPKADVYLFKDPDIEPRHATITKSGNRYVLRDEGGGSGVFVNGKKVSTYVLRPGDVISIGQAVLKYHDRSK